MSKRGVAESEQCQAVFVNTGSRVQPEKPQRGIFNVVQVH